MKLLKKIKSFIGAGNNRSVNKVFVNKKSCPHCVSRGFVTFSDSERTNNCKQEVTKSILVLIFLLGFQISVFSQTDGFVSVKGKEFILPDGKSILLKGINLGNWLVPEGYMFHFQKTSSPRLIYDLFDVLIGEEEANKFWDAYRENYITKEDIHFIKSLGLNSIRIPFNYKLFVTDYPYRELKGVGYTLLNRVINWCKEENLYAIFDMHCAPGGQTGDNIDDSYGYPFLFESEESQQLMVDVWKRLAEIYKDETIVIGYDLMNEPIAHFYDKEKLNPKLEPLYKRITSAIREVDKNHIIFIGGAQWNTNFSIFGPPFDDKLAYTFHTYWTEVEQKVIQSYVDFSNKYNVPMWLGESGENTDEWINNFRTLLEKNNIGWCFWPYKKMKSERGIVSINQPEYFDLIIEFAEGDTYSYGAIRDRRPNAEKVKLALNQYLENCKLKNCTINDGYIKALGLR
ncbi:MAG: cellulase family glycosylhydrolase [Ignavibacteriaceae bacterium]|nr:cellulase family glycosylhydrolase [Ignavibacteriaceae bacterium]